MAITIRYKTFTKSWMIGMALPNLRKGFASRAAAVGLGAVAAFTPLSFTFADDAGRKTAQPATTISAPAQATPVLANEHAGIQANKWSLKNPGIAVGVFLGTAASTPSAEKIQQVLTADFQKAGVEDPIVFFFQQNDVPTTGVDYHFGGDVRGPYSLGEARPATEDVANTYNWRKQQGLLASISYNQ